MTAYWVVYVNEEVAKQMEKADIYQYKQSEFIDKSHIYSSHIPGAINLLVDDDNNKLREEILTY